MCDSYFMWQSLETPNLCNVHSLRLSLQPGVKSTILRADCSSVPLKPVGEAGHIFWHSLHRGTCGALVWVWSGCENCGPLQATPDELLRHIGRTIAKCNHQNWTLRGERWAAPHWEWLPAQSGGGGGPGRAFLGWGGQWWRCYSDRSPASWWRGGIELEENILPHATAKEDIRSFDKSVVTVVTRL